METNNTVLPQAEEPTKDDVIKRACEAKIEGKPVAWIDTHAIDIREIYSNSRNFYACSDIEQLAQSIKCFGLMENLTVVDRPNGDGKRYRIVAGERRWRALKMLAEQGHTEFYKVTCVIIDGKELDDNQEMLRLIAANQYRQKTFTEQSEEIRQIKQILQNDPAAEGGRIRDAVSRLTGISGTKIAQIEAIDHNLIGAFRDALKGGDIAFSVAYELSGLPSEEQAKLYGGYMMGDQLSVQQIRDLKAEMAEADKEMDGQMTPDDFAEDLQPDKAPEADPEEDPEEPAEAEGAAADPYAEGLDPTDQEIADAWDRVKDRIQISSETTKTGLLELLKRRMGSGWQGFSVHDASIWYINCDPVGIRLEAESPDGREASRKRVTWKAFADKVIAAGLFTPAPELVDAHPQAKESICYNCDNYEHCAQKQTNVTTCDSYVDRKEARKTEEQRYSEEQDRIDRDTKKKLQEMEDQKEAEKAKTGPDEKSFRQRGLRTMRVSEKMLDDINTQRIPYMIVMQDKQMPYREGDRLLLLAVKDGAHTGKTMKACITCVDDAGSSSGIVEGYAVIGVMDIYDAESLGLIDLEDED